MTTGILSTLTVMIILQYIHMLNHDAVHPKLHNAIQQLYLIKKNVTTGLGQGLAQSVLIRGLGWLQGK